MLLGSDSLLSGDGNLLDEVGVARRTGLLSDSRIEAAIGAVAARRLGLPRNSLQTGDAADLVVLAKPLLEASARDVELVMVGGVPRVARPDLAPALGKLGFRGHSMTVAGVERWTCSGPGALQNELTGRDDLNHGSCKGTLPAEGGGRQPRGNGE